MIKNNTNIKDKIKQMQQYAHTFNFEPNDALKDICFTNNIISIIEHDKMHHFIHFLSYNIKKDVIAEKIEYKEVYLKVDRLYYLEIANSTIDSNQKFEFLLSVMGQRRFGTNNDNLSKFLISKQFDMFILSKKIKEWEKNLLKNANDSILYEMQSKNLNIFEGFLASEQNHYFVYLRQKNISKLKTTQKDFLVEFTKEQFEEIQAQKHNHRKLYLVFVQIGKIYLKQMTPLESVVYDFNKKEILSFIFDIDKDDAKQEVKDNILDKAISQDDKNRLNLTYLNLYKASMNYLKNPSDNILSEKMAKSIMDYSLLLGRYGEFEEVITFFVCISALIGDSEFSAVFKNDESFNEIFISTIETIGEWQGECVFDENCNQADKESSTKNVIENLKFLIKHFENFKEIGNDAKELESNNTKQNGIYNTEVISAQQFFEEHFIDKDFCDELDELENDVLELLYVSDTLNEKLYKSIKVFFQKYAKMVNSYYEFKNLGYILNNMVSLLEKTDIKKLESYKKEFLKALCNSIIKDLSAWKKSVIADKSATDIHYLDASFQSNVAQIEMLLNPNQQQSVDDGVEFF